MIENFREDPVFAVKLINSVLADGDADELRDVLELMSAAFGDGSGQHNDVGDLIATIRAMGLQLSVAPAPASRKRSAQPGATKRAGRVRRPAAKTEKVHA
jgi:DNA-binding phage protein